MPTTTKMGIVYPSSTDLVKDGATAMGTISTTVDSKTGLVLLNTTTFSAVSSVIVDNVFSSSFDNYLIQMQFTASTSAAILYYLRASSADTTTNYQRQYINLNSSTGTVFRASDSEIGIMNSTGNNALEFLIYSPNLAQRTLGFSRAVRDLGGLEFNIYSTQQTTTTQFTGIKMLTSSGNFTGAISIFGANK